MDKQQDIARDDWDSQLADYMFGAMDADTASMFERRLTECREHVELAEQYSQVAGWLALAAPAAEPPEGHKMRLMSKLAAVPQEAAEVTAPSGTLDAPPARLHLVPGASMEAPPAAMQTAGPTPVADLGEYRERKRGGSFLPALGALAAAFVLLLGGWTWMQSQAQSQLNIPPGYVAFPVLGQGDVKANGVVFF
ncbi:MAG TPA: hypothetical protein VM409_02855, partial [Chloroflexia bacterium]|nr:hypothetical protein [Chloroflexia bacterium]